MCGIAGILNSKLAPAALDAKLLAMQRRLRHRGPDDQGRHVDTIAASGFVHTRLAIQDLTPAGRQPMESDDKRFHIVFNGEIYNFPQLRRELIDAGERFRSQTDTEVILRLYQRSGVNVLDRLEGMFAFAIWDRERQSCFLARDPLGIKPLYIWQVADSLAFASEIRALLCADLGPRQLDPTALQGYLLFGSVQEPHTLVSNVKMLPAGNWLEWQDGETRQGRFWELPFERTASHSSSTETVADHTEPVTLARKALADSVQRHFVSDVPVGVFLSGGLDSTAVVALAKHCGYDNLRTFSISFDEQEFDEGHLAARTARHFATEHFDRRMTGVDGRQLLRDYLNALDQPSNDGFNTFCVSKFAHETGAKVVLSGLGGDELFAGYPSFSHVPQLVRLHRRASVAGSLPRRLAAAMCDQFRSNRWYRVAEFLRSEGGACAAYWAMRGFFLSEESQRLVEHYSGTKYVAQESGPYGSVTGGNKDLLDTVGFLETTRYMRNQLLRDSDVMSMAWGLELRVPLVDSRLIESVSQVASGTRLALGKALLVDAVPEMPEWIRRQPKRGFRFPFEQWIAGEWGDVFDELTGSCPVSLKNWHRRWSLFTLEHFLQSNRIEYKRSLPLDREIGLAAAG